MKTNTVFKILIRDFFRKIKKKGCKKFFFENILESGDSPLKKALSITLGVFIGIAPFWGFQTVLVLFLAYLLRLNKVIAFAFSNVSFPPFIPFIIYGSLEIGSFFVPRTTPVLGDATSTMAIIRQNLFQYITGSFILASVMSALFGAVGYIILTFFSPKSPKPLRNA